MGALRALLALLIVSRSASAQLGRWTTSVALGWGVGESLWALDRQPVYGGTVALRRAVGAGLHLAATVAYRPVSAMALTAEVFLLETPVRTSCRPIDVTTAGPPEWCALKDGESLANHSSGLTGGIRMDLAGRAALRPYLRASVGAVFYGVSTVAIDAIPGVSRAVVVDSHQHRSAATALLAAGLARPFGTTRELQLEVRDMMIDFDRVTAPADSVGTAPTQRRMAHEIVVSLGVRMDLYGVTHPGKRGVAVP